MLRLTSIGVGDSLRVLANGRLSPDMNGDGLDDLVFCGDDFEAWVIPDVRRVVAAGGTQAMTSVAAVLEVPGTTRAVSCQAGSEVMVVDLDGDANDEAVFVGRDGANASALWVWDADAVVGGASFDAEVDLSGFIIPGMTGRNHSAAVVLDRDGNGAEELALLTTTGAVQAIRPVSGVMPPPAPAVSPLPAWAGVTVTGGGDHWIRQVAAGPDFDGDGRSDVIALVEHEAWPRRAYLAAF
jgi:hypothetical protein